MAGAVWAGVPVFYGVQKPRFRHRRSIYAGSVCGDYEGTVTSTSSGKKKRSEVNNV